MTYVGTGFFLWFAGGKPQVHWLVQGSELNSAGCCMLTYHPPRFPNRRLSGLKGQRAPNIHVRARDQWAASARGKVKALSVHYLSLLFCGRNKYRNRRQKKERCQETVFVHFPFIREVELMSWDNNAQNGIFWLHKIYKDTLHLPHLLGVFLH